MYVAYMNIVVYCSHLFSYFEETNKVEKDVKQESLPKHSITKVSSCPYMYTCAVWEKFTI